jgi:hypothetical protein
MGSVYATVPGEPTPFESPDPDDTMRSPPGIGRRSRASGKRSIPSEKGLDLQACEGRQLDARPLHRFLIRRMSIHAYWGSRWHARISEEFGFHGKIALTSLATSL